MQSTEKPCMGISQTRDIGSKEDLPLSVLPKYRINIKNALRYYFAVVGCIY